MDEYTDEYADEVYEDAPSQSSIATPLIRALLAAAVAFAVYAVVFSDIGGGDDVDVAADLTVEPTPVPLPVAPAPTAPAQATPAPTSSALPDATSTDAAGLVGAGVSVQVIAGAGTTADQLISAVAALTELGYDVTQSSSPSPNPYPQTTIFASPGQEAQAQALNAADDRFTTYDPDFPGLNENLNIHVLVGEDWPTT
jgi:hypothetical protein